MCTVSSPDTADIPPRPRLIQTTGQRIVSVLGQEEGYTAAWTKNIKLWISWSLMVANDVSIPKECFAKISEFLKRNWPRAARI